MNILKTLFENQQAVLADGAMGTSLFEAGLQFGDPPDLWNILHPDRVRAIQRRYIEAGSQIILTNTFGGTRFRLKLHNLDGRVHELNRAGAENLRAEVTASGKPVLVAGDIGPSGEIMAPLGDLTFDAAVDGFAEQAAGLAAGGVDLFWIETMSDLDEVRAAIEGARRAAPHLPIICTLSFDTHGCTMMGVTPETAAKFMRDQGLFAGGGNCGNGSDEMLEVVRRMHAAEPELIVVAKSNAGMPVLVQGKAVYQATPEEMGEFAVRARALGARLIGGCCGNNQNHIQAMATRLQDTAYEPQAPATAGAAPAPAKKVPVQRANRRRAT